VGFVGVLWVCLWVGCFFGWAFLSVFVGALSELGFFFGALRHPCYAPCIIGLRPFKFALFDIQF
jgi:hypothetical protein